MADSVQGQGLGTELGWRSPTPPARAGVVRLTATMLADNLPAHRLLRADVRPAHARAARAGNQALVARARGLG